MYKQPLPGAKNVQAHFLNAGNLPRHLLTQMPPPQEGDGAKLRCKNFE